ncbi:hypothetical protein GC425_05405 [Corynebacterium sp. zg254]|uniref:Transposase n=2 Tax=Corynebacteriaceae TaxID=1653 RepID=A0ABQ6VE35_9CORY|nr:hypothetical protein F8377_00200 [Corynebacterium zhongnanshanii]MCR5914302.1 hypothetical protein [Corynebacterium sp. zg254]
MREVEPREGRVAAPLLEGFVAENVGLRRENRVLRDTNELLKAASTFSRQLATHNVGSDPVHR